MFSSPTKMDFNISKIVKEISENYDKKILEKMILIYKYNFEVIKKFIDDLFISLIKNSIPSAPSKMLVKCLFGYRLSACLYLGHK